MNKYNTCMTFKSIKELQQYRKDTGCNIPAIKITERIELGSTCIPKGKIIEYKDTTWDHMRNYVISPLYGVGSWITIGRNYAKEV